MSIVELIFLLVAGFLSGMINAIAGGGTFFTFGAMGVLGIPPLVANATSSISQFPGYVTSTLAYYSDIKTMWRSALKLAAISAVAAFLGAWLLLLLDNEGFKVLVPWLLLGATGVFAAGPWLKRRKSAGVVMSPNLGLVVQFLTAVYGGFFGAGMGIMMLATLGMTEKGDYHRLNALKNLLAIVIAFVAILVFVAGGVIDWPAAFVLIPGVAVGGYSGVWAARRMPEPVVRWIVVGTGLVLSVYYFIK